MGSITDISKSETLEIMTEYGILELNLSGIERIIQTDGTIVFPEPIKPVEIEKPKVVIPPAIIEETARELAAREKLKKEQQEKEQADIELAAREKLLKEQQDKEQVAKREASQKEKELQENAAKTLEARKLALQEQMAKELAERERALEEEIKKELAAKEQKLQEEAAIKLAKEKLTEEIKERTPLGTDRAVNTVPENLPCELELAIKAKMTTELFDLSKTIEADIAKNKDTAKIAGRDLTENFQKVLYRDFKEQVDISSMLNNTSKLQSIITFNTDIAGKITSVEKNIYTAKNTIQYTELTAPFLNRRIGKYLVPDSSKFDYSREYTKFYTKHAYKIVEDGCPLSLFDETFELAKIQLNTYNQNKLAVNTSYQVPFNYTFDKRFQKWKVKDDRVYIVKQEGDQEIEDLSVINDFKSRLKKTKEGTYSVVSNYHTILDEDPEVKILSVKEKHIKYLHIGATISTNLNQKDTSNIFLGSNEFVGYNVSLIYSHIGAYYGGLLYQENKRQDSDGTHLQGTPKYNEFGLLLGLGQHLYLKGGYAMMTTEAARFRNNVKINNASSADYTGIVGGISLVFTGVQVEATYNSIFNSYHIGAGFNLFKNL